MAVPLMLAVPERRPTEPEIGEYLDRLMAATRKYHNRCYHRTFVTTPSSMARRAMGRVDSAVEAHR